MELDFYKTYNNVSFRKWERFCRNETDKDRFITEIKNENPEVIIVKEEKNHDYQSDGDTLVTITGVQIIVDILKDYLLNYYKIFIKNYKDSLRFLIVFLVSQFFSRFSRGSKELRKL